MSSDSEDKPLLFDAGLAAAPLTTDANVEDEEKAEVDPPGAENYDQDLFSAETQAVERPVSESDETDDEMLNQQTQALEPAGADNSEERDLFAADTQAAPIYVSDSDETDDELFNMQTQAAPIVVSDEESGDQPSTSAHSKANSQNMSTTSRTKEGQVKITHVTVSDSDETDDEMFNMQTQAAPIIISDEESEPKPPEADVQVPQIHNDRGESSEAESVDDVFKMGAKSNKKCSSSTNTSLDVSRPAHDASADTVLLEKSADSTPPRRKSRPTLLLMRDSPDLMASSINVMSGKNSSSLNIVDDSVEESHDGDVPGSPDIFNMSTQVADVHVPSSDSDQDEVIAAETPDVSFVGTKSANNRRVNGQAEGELDSDELFVAQTQPAFEDVLEDVVADVAPGEPEINSPTNEIVSTTLAIGDVTSTPGGDKDAVDSATSKTDEVNGGPAVDSVAVEVNGEPAVKSGRNRRGRPGKSDVVKEQPKDVSNSLDDLLAEVGESRRSKSERKVSFAPDTPQQEVGETLMKRTRQKPLRYRQPATPCDAASLEVPTSTQAKETELVQTPDPNTSSTEPVSISSPLTSTHPHSPDQPHKSGKPELVSESHLTSDSQRVSRRKRGKQSADAVEIKDSSQPSPPLKEMMKVKETEPTSELLPAPVVESRTRRAGKRKTVNKSSDVEMASSTTATSLSSPTKDSDSIPAPSTQPDPNTSSTEPVSISSPLTSTHPHSPDQPHKSGKPELVPESHLTSVVQTDSEPQRISRRKRGKESTKAAVEVNDSSQPSQETLKVKDTELASELPSAPAPRTRRTGKRKTGNKSSDVEMASSTTATSLSSPTKDADSIPAPSTQPDPNTSNTEPVSISSPLTSTHPHSPDQPHKSGKPELVPESHLKSVVQTDSEPQRISRRKRGKESAKAAVEVNDLSQPSQETLKVKDTELASELPSAPAPRTRRTGKRKTVNKSSDVEMASSTTATSLSSPTKDADSIPAPSTQPDPDTSSTEPVSISSPLTSTHPHSPDQPHKSGKPELVSESHLTSDSTSRRISRRKKGKEPADAVEVKDSSQPSPPLKVTSKVKDTEPTSESLPAPAKGSRTRRAGKRNTVNKSSDVEMASSTTATSLSSPTKDADSIPAPSTQPDPDTSSTEPVSISSPLTSTHPHSPDQPHKSGKPELVPESHLTSGSNSRRFSERKKGKVSADAVEVQDSSQPSPPKVVKVKDTEPASELPPAPAKGSRTRRAGKRKTGNKSSDVEMTSSTTATSLSSPTKDADSIPAPSTQPGRQRKTTKELKVSVVGISSSSQGSSSSAESARTPSVTTVSTGTQTPTTRRTRRGRRAEPIATSSTTPESVAGSKRKRGRGLSSTCLDSPSKQSSSTQFMSVPSTPSRSTGSSPAKKPKKGRKIETIIEPVTEAETDITHDLEHTEGHRSLRTPLVKVTFTGLAETQSLEKMAEQLGWTVTADMSKSTHVVADQVKRTIKFMCAVSRGLHIVTSQWVVESHKMNKCLDVAKYSLRDRKAEKLHGFNLESSLSWARSHPEGVLNGCKVFVSKNTQPPPEEIKELVTSAGGKIYKTLPKVAEKNLYVVSCDQDKRLYHRLMGEGHTVVSKEFVLSTILKQQLCVNEHKLK